MKYLITLLLVFSLSSAYSQETSTKLGIYGGLNLNSHTADFYKLQGIPNCCPAFETGDGMGFNAGILYEYRIMSNIWLGARLGIMTLDGELTKSEPTTIITPSGPEDGAFEHKLNGYFTNIGFEPSLIYNPFGGLLLSVGARLGTNIRSDFDQIETLTNPDYGTFLDSLGNDTFSRSRNEYSGEIPNSISFQLALLGSISYELPLNRNGSLLLAPEIAYYFPFSEMVENTDWKCSSLRADIAFKYSPMPDLEKEEIHHKEYHIDTIRVETDIIAENTYKKGIPITRSEQKETDDNIIITDFITRIDTMLIARKYKIQSRVIAVGIDENGNEIPNPIFKIEEFESSKYEPLLNYVFFQDNSSELSNKYHKISNNETNDFRIDSLYNEGTLDIYYNLLNIVGLRMRENPKAKITLIGCNADIGNEKADKELSMNRAESVKKYLVDIWSISDDRIKLESRNLPEKASTPINEPEKAEENRRVEIYSYEPKILEPIFLEQIIRSANPPIARFIPMTEAEAGLKTWEFYAYQGFSNSESKRTNALFTKSGKEELPDYIDWKFELVQKNIPAKPEPIIYSLMIEDKKGNKDINEEQTLPIDVLTVREKRINRVGDYELQKYSLILFDFDKSSIEGNNQKIIDFIQSRVKRESEIEIIGYTDRTGEDAYNKKLSERRAESTKAMLKRQDAKAQGIGEEALLYNNDIPEGRFYCRTVNIIVKTPIK